MAQHYHSPSTKSGGLEDNEDHKNLCGSTSPRRPLFKAIALLDTKVFVARAMLATKVKVVNISPSMLELSITVVKDRAVLATQAAKARAVLKFLVYNEATCSFVSAG